MNKLEMAQRVAEDFFKTKDKVVEVKRNGPLSAVIVFENGKERIVNGSLAVDLLYAKE